MSDFRGEQFEMRPAPEMSAEDRRYVDEWVVHFRRDPNATFKLGGVTYRVGNFYDAHPGSSARYLDLFERYDGAFQVVTELDPTFYPPEHGLAADDARLTMPAYADAVALAATIEGGFKRYVDPNIVQPDSNTPQ